MVADSLVYHPSVAHYLKFVATTVGRDKLLRTLQYFSRFYAWYLYRTNGTPGQIAPFDAIKKQFGLARKLMRVGKNVEHFKAAAIAADSKTLDPVVKYCAVGRQLGYAGYLTFDAVTYLDAAGIRKSPATQRLQREAYRCWMIGLLFSTVSGAYSLYNLRQQATKLDKKEGEDVVASKRIEKYAGPTCLTCQMVLLTMLQGAYRYKSSTYIRPLRSYSTNICDWRDELR
jgi:peroxin-11B